MKQNRKNPQHSKRPRGPGKVSSTAPKELLPKVADAPVEAAPLSINAIPAEIALPRDAPALAVNSAIEAATANTKVNLSASTATGGDLPVVTAEPGKAPVASQLPVVHVVEPKAVPAAETPVVAADGEGAVPAASMPSKRVQAEQIVRDYIPLAVGAGLIPVPGADLAAIGGLQLKVLAALAEHYGVAFTRAQAQVIVTSLLGAVGTTVLAGTMFLSLAKVIPGLGTLLGAASLPLAGGAITHAIGHLAIDHFESGGTMMDFDLDVAQRAFAQKLEAAKATLA